MFWDEASRHLTLSASDIAAYREALLARFSNPRAGDQLARIAADGSTKLLVRTVPTIRAERAGGRVPVGCATTVAAWILHLRGLASMAMRKSPLVARWRSPLVASESPHSLFVVW
jgi:fructuronate reductase